MDSSESQWPCILVTLISLLMISSVILFVELSVSPCPSDGGSLST